MLSQVNDDVGASAHPVEVLEACSAWSQGGGHELLINRAADSTRQMINGSRRVHSVTL